VPASVTFEAPCSERTQGALRGLAQPQGQSAVAVLMYFSDRRSCLATRARRVGRTRRPWRSGTTLLPSRRATRPATLSPGPSRSAGSDRRRCFLRPSQAGQRTPCPGNDEGCGLDPAGRNLFVVPAPVVVVRAVQRLMQVADEVESNLRATTCSSESVAGFASSNANSSIVSTTQSAAGPFEATVPGGNEG